MKRINSALGGRALLSARKVVFNLGRADKSVRPPRDIYCNFSPVIFALVILLSASVSIKAESSLSSLGYGLQFDASSARSAGMGLAGLGIADSLSLDLTMPANWAGPRTARFGFNSYAVRETATDNGGTDASDNGGVGGVGFVVAVGKTSFLGFSITPVTSMDYRWKSTGVASWSSTLTRRQGQGGLSQALVGGSMQINDKLRLGLAVRPIFGKVERLWKLDYPNGGGFSASQTISDRFSGIGVSLSGRWYEEDWNFGALINTPVSASVQRQLVIGAGGLAQVDSTYDLAEKYDLPLDIGVGVSKKYNQHLVAIDAFLHNWGSVEPPSIEGGRFENSYRLSAGWEWSPDYRSVSSFWQEWKYRAGFTTSNNYGISASGHQAGKFALTGGLGIPYAKGRSRLDLAIEFGWAGNETDDGVAERTLGVTVGFNHSEKWFVGRRGK